MSSRAQRQPEPSHHVIESVKVDGRYMVDLFVELADGLNCIIGGTGAGKTTLLELILFALGVAIPASRKAAHDALVADALGSGRVTVWIRTRHGVRYQCSRSVGEPPRVTDADGVLVEGGLSPETFTIEYRAATEILAIATDPKAQLDLLDRFVEPELRPLLDDMARLGRRLEDNAVARVALERSIEEDVERAGELPALTAALRGLQTPAGVDPAAAKRAFDDKERRIRERAALAHQAELVEERRALVDKLARDRSCFSPRLDADVEAGPNRDVMATLAGELRTIGAADAEAMGRLAAGLEAARGAVSRASVALAERQAVADDALRTLTARQEEGRGIVAERARLEKRVGEVTAIARRQEARQRELAELREARGGMLADLARLRETRLGLRERARSEINEALDGRVRVALAAGEDRTRYEALLKELTTGANIRPSTFLEVIARDMRPEELVRCALADDIEPLVAIDPSKTKQADRARLVLAALRASGRLFELETVGVDDVPLVELQTTRGYRGTTELSNGERCTAVLSIVLLRCPGPLLIDEPEQHLHNKLIYTVLVKMLAEAQIGGQLVFITHNANIVALGEAKRVFIIEAGGGHGWVEEFGTVDELKGAIVLLEGGKEAFRRRAKKYKMMD